MRLKYLLINSLPVLPPALLFWDNIERAGKPPAPAFRHVGLAT